MVFKTKPNGKHFSAVPTCPILVLFAIILLLGASKKTIAEDAVRNTWWSDTTEQALVTSGTNRQQLVTALQHVPPAKRDELQFLIENAPAPDLQTLSAGYLLENLTLADEALASASWRDEVPPDIFLNEILPYACVNETRDAWRAMLRKICAPLAADAKTPGEAACRINENVFKLVNVHYSTARKKADQSPSESMQNGLASCTGLSILLVDACRSVGIPARLAGTPMWSNLRGNHTWVEVWDKGWHFIGASEPDAQGLDHAWFENDAAAAVADSPAHAIYAASFKKTGLIFPLDWAPEINWVNAVNVTGRYTTNAAPAPDDRVRVLVRVFDFAGHRVAAKVTVTDITKMAMCCNATSKGESADMNNRLPVETPRDGIYKIRAERDGQAVEQIFTTGTNTPEFLDLAFDRPVVVTPLKAKEAAKLKKALTEFFTAPAEKQANWKFAGSMKKLLLNNEPAVRQIAWEAFKSAPVHGKFKQDFDAKQVQFENYSSPYTVKFVGERPTNGWALFIAMHGGGGTAKEVNDSQWKIMESHYKEHPEAGGYIYLALRAPNDTWNGFYDVYVYPLIANLVHEFLLFGDVNPDKVFIMGYSHGGYGAFAIGPKEPDLFAAIHASSAAPTAGETTAKTLRNTLFTCMVGELDTMYGRHDRDAKFRDEIAQLRGDRADIYPVAVDIVPGGEHSSLKDRDKITEMYPAVRNPVPRDLTWLMTDKVITDFFWLHTDTPDKQGEVDASCHDNHLTVTTTNVPAATVLLDGRLVDFAKPVTITVNGMTITQKIQPGLRVLCETMQRRCDPDLAFTAELALPIGASKP